MAVGDPPINYPFYGCYSMAISNNVIYSYPPYFPTPITDPYPQTPPSFPRDTTNPYPITPSYFPTLIDKPKNPWQCPACKTWYAPHVDKCECEKK